MFSPFSAYGLMRTSDPAFSGRFVPALGWSCLTPLYDGVLRLGGREQTFKGRLIEQAGIQPGEAALDLGCGTGTLAIELKRRHPDVEVVGLDGDPDMLWRARAKARRADLPLRFDEGLSWNLPYPDAAFDVVLSTLFFHHLDRPGRFRTLVEVVRVLKSGGRLHVADWGRQTSPLMTVLSFPDRVLDGLERTAPAFSGQLTAEMTAAGLRRVSETGTVDTGFGRLTLYAARRR